MANKNCALYIYIKYLRKLNDLYNYCGLSFDFWIAKLGLWTEKYVYLDRPINRNLDDLHPRQL